MAETDGEAKAALLAAMVRTRYDELHARRGRIARRGLRMHPDTSILPGLGLTLFVVPLVARRIDREEEMLAAEFGQEYEGYRQQVPWRSMPYVF